MTRRITKLSDLIDVNDLNKQNQYVLTFNQSTNNWEAVNPDDVLSASATEPVSPGLPSDFSNELADVLDPVLDNEIDVDAGTF